MAIYKKENKFVSLILILISFVILILIILPKFWEINEKNLIKAEIIKKKDYIEKELNNLNEIKKIAEKNKDEYLKYSSGFTEDEILNYLMDHTHNKPKFNSNEYIKINNISIEKSRLNELWFNEIWLNIDISYSSVKKLLDFIDYLTDRKNKYSFFITKLNIDMNSIEQSGSIKLNLRYFYK